MKAFLFVIILTTSAIDASDVFSLWQPLPVDGAVPVPQASCLGFNQDEDTLLIGTSEGYRFFSFNANTYSTREIDDIIGFTTGAIAMPASVPGRVVTGRQDAFFKGYISVHDNLSIVGTTAYESNGGGFTAMVVDPQNQSIMYAANISDIISGEFLKSNDAGSSWFIPGNYLHTAMMDIAIHPVDNDILFVAGDAGITRSEDAGATWVVSSSGLPAGLDCYKIAISEDDPKIMLTSTDNGIYRSTDGGQNWNLADTRVAAGIAFFKGTNETVVAAITFDNEFIGSFDSGASWEDHTDNINGSVLMDIRVSSEDGNCYVLTAEDGVYFRSITALGIDDPEPVFGQNFLLYSNYPNPFNPRTTIAFNMGQQGKVTLDVYNVLGQKVRSLIAGTRQGGLHSLQWDGRDNSGNALATGVYLLQLKAFGDVQTRKMILHK
jgi:hypothetical protein